MDTPGTPQNLAAQWMLNEDTLTEDLSEEKQIQRYGLTTFYYSTGGAAAWGAQRRQASSSSWLSADTDDCNWSFIVCNSDQEIVALELIPPAPMLMGSLPAEIGLWTSLAQFVINTGDAQEAAAARQFVEPQKARLGTRQGVTNQTGVNMLTGWVPSEIGLLTLLETFQITNQALKGDLPIEIGNATSLVTLDLTNNQLWGTIPLTLGFIGGLTEIRLGHNGLQGPVKKGLFNREGGLAQSLTGLYLNNNMLRGSLPDEIGLLSSLESGLDLSSNRLGGTLPTTLGQLTQIKVFRINDNLFTGTIPGELQSWAQIEEFQIQDNGFTGELPGDLCRAFAVLGTNVYAECEEITCTCCTFCCSDEVCTEEA
jgi:Leucine-rich repeat (LRR) protein